METPPQRLASPNPSVDTLTRGVMNLLDRFSRPENGGQVNEKVSRIESKKSTTPTQTASSYQDFISQLKLLANDAPDLLKRIGDFTEQINHKEIVNTSPVFDADSEPGQHEEFSKEIKDFILQQSKELSLVWSTPTRPCRFTKKELSHHLSRLIFSKVYVHVFAPTLSHRDMDHVLKNKISQIVHVLDPVKNLDLKPSLLPTSDSEKESWNLASSQLLKLSQLKSPHEKMQCVLATCSLVIEFIKQKKELAIPDVFIPALVYLLIRTNPPQLFSNVEFIAAYFIHPHEEPFFVHFASAVGFLVRSDAKSLSMEEEEEIPLFEASWLEERFRFEEIADAKDMKLGEVSQLLDEYKTLAQTLRQVLQCQGKKSLK